MVVGLGVCFGGEAVVEEIAPAPNSASDFVSDADNGESPTGVSFPAAQLNTELASKEHPEPPEGRGDRGSYNDEVICGRCKIRRNPRADAAVDVVLSTDGFGAGEHRHRTGRRHDYGDRMMAAPQSDAPAGAQPDDRCPQQRIMAVPEEVNASSAKGSRPTVGQPYPANELGDVVMAEPGARCGRCHRATRGAECGHVGHGKPTADESIRHAHADGGSQWTAAAVDDGDRDSATQRPGILFSSRSKPCCMPAVMASTSGTEE
jgi:hypothetical protein